MNSPQQTSTSRILDELRNNLLIITGSALVALGVVLFLAPNNIATGGSPGLAILLHHLSNLTIGSLMLLINIPLLLGGIKYLGKAFAVRTVISIVVTAGFVDLFREVLHLSPVSSDLLLATLFGGIIIGIGVGLILRGNGSAGGSTIIARIVSSRTRIKPGRVILLVDVLIIIAAAFVFNGIEPSLWSLISIYVTSKCIDIVVTGGPSEKIVHIVTDEVELLCRQIQEQLGPHGTVITGHGLQKHEEKTMIFVVVDNSRLALLGNLIRQHDPNAFMVVMEASEMLGRGHL